MEETSAKRLLRWQQIVGQLTQDYNSLSLAEKEQLTELLSKIERLQIRLDRLFRKADGEQICADCEGACCAKGHNHAGLVNLLSYLEQGVTPPAADFTRTCPWLGPDGCHHQAKSRPYNCITFLCDKLEVRLEKTDIDEFYRLESDLRKLYFKFSDLYAGGGMSGLLLQAERLNGMSLLSKKTAEGTIPRSSNQNEVEF